MLQNKTVGGKVVPTKRILVVDDQANIRKVVAICLQMLGGWNVLTATSGQEALQQVRAEPFDVIVLDWAMPEMDGFTFLQYLHSDPSIRHIPVVLLTATNPPPKIQALSALGVVLVISKPFLPVELIQQMTQVLKW